MSIQFDQIEGVVQRDAEEPQPQASPSSPTSLSPQPTPAEQFEASHRRMEWMTRRLTAD